MKLVQLPVFRSPSLSVTSAYGPHGSPHTMCWSNLKTTQTSTQTPGPNTRGTHDAHIQTGSHARTSQQPQPPSRRSRTRVDRPTDARLGACGDGGGPVGLEAHEVHQLSHLHHSDRLDEGLAVRALARRLRRPCFVCSRDDGVCDYIVFQAYLRRSQPQ